MVEDSEFSEVFVALVADQLVDMVLLLTNVVVGGFDFIYSDFKAKSKVSFSALAVSLLPLFVFDCSS